MRLSKDLQFLIACCQADLSQDDIEFIRTFIDEEHSTLDSIIPLAIQHGILPLVYYSIKTHTEDMDIAPFLSELKQNYQAIAQRNILMSAELIRITQLLEKNNVEVLAFKGPTLAQMAYGDITLRQYSDLDILVEDKTAYEAASVLIDQGYINLNPLQMLKNDVCLDVAKDFHLLTPNGTIHIEMHWNLFEKKHKTDLSSLGDQVFTQHIKINNKPLKTLSNELLLVYLCIHGSKHAWERIEWICDVDRLVRSQDIDWKQVIVISHQLKSQRAFFLGVKLSNMLLHTPTSDSLSLPNDHKQVIDLLDMTFERLVNPKRYASNLFATLNYQSQLLDTKNDQYGLYFNTLFNISRGDCENLALPKSLKFLYILLKPFRIVYKYIYQINSSKNIS